MSCVHTFKDHSNVVHTVRFSHDDSLIVSGACDDTIKVQMLFCFVVREWSSSMLRGVQECVCDVIVHREASIG